MNILLFENSPHVCGLSSRISGRPLLKSVRVETAPFHRNFNFRRHTLGSSSENLKKVKKVSFFAFISFHTSSFFFFFGFNCVVCVLTAASNGPGIHANTAVHGIKA